MQKILPLILLLMSNIAIASQQIIICKNDKEVFFIQPEKILYFLVGVEERGTQNGFIAIDTKGKQRMLLQDLNTDTCVIGDKGGDV